MRENWYRDVWLLVITALVFWALWSFQNERWQNVRRNCEDANQRYATTVLALDQLIAQAPSSQQRRARASREQTLSLIRTLAPPHFDALGHSTCNAIADRQVSRWP